jgi:hypothetical protein
MTIKELRAMTNWTRTLKWRAVYCLYNGDSWRIVGVGTARVTLLKHTGVKVKVDPHYIAAITGLL